MHAWSCGGVPRWVHMCVQVILCTCALETVAIFEREKALKQYLQPCLITHVHECENVK